MWNELYNNVKVWMLSRKPEEWIVSTIENSRQMKNSFHEPRAFKDWILFLEQKASEETAIAEGDILYEGGLFSSIGGAGYDG